MVNNTIMNIRPTYQNYSPKELKTISAQLHQMSYPTQEDELRVKEARAENSKQSEESKFLSTFKTTPKKNIQRLSELADNIVKNFNAVMDNARWQPYERQEDLMAGLQKLFNEQINVIDARYAYTLKINPSTAKTRAE